MNNPRQLISDHIKNFLDRKNVEADFDVSLVSNPQHGDFATNVGLIASKKLGRNPRELSEEIVSFLGESDDVKDVFEKIEVAGPGFINFYLSKKYLSSLIQKITQDKEELGSLKTKNPQTVIVEFGDPNPFKEIHIGHLRNFCIGESFSRLLESQGSTAVRANYQGDVGLHVAKAMWGLLKKEEQFLDSGLSLENKVKILAESYVEGAKEFEENESAKQEIIDINKRIYSDDESLKQLWDEGKKVSLEHFEEIYKRIGVSYAKYYFESETAKRGKEIVKANVPGVFENSDGAVVFRGENEGLHTRVFLSSQGYATYEGKDLALAVMKNEEEKFDKSIILTGNEQLEYFQVMLKALSKIEPEVAANTKHLTFGHVRLKEGKMSSRTGDVISATWLLDEAVFKVKEAFPEVEDATAEKVALAAVKYSMLKFGISSDIHFDFNESISLEGNSGPYILYSYVRTRSVLNKANNQRQLTNDEKGQQSEVSSQKLEVEESDLLRFLAQYPYVLENANQEFSPNLVCNYLFELSQKFNLFYQKHKIIGSESETFRLSLTESVGQILKNGLNILNIETVERM